MKRSRIIVITTIFVIAICGVGIMSLLSKDSPKGAARQRAPEVISSTKKPKRSKDAAAQTTETAESQAPEAAPSSDQPSVDDVTASTKQGGEVSNGKRNLLPSSIRRASGQQMLAMPTPKLANNAYRRKLSAELTTKSEKSYAKALQMAKAYGWPIKGENFELVGVDPKDNSPIYHETYNNDAAQAISTDLVRSKPLFQNVDGSAMIFGLWDLGLVMDNHDSFMDSNSSRITHKDIKNIEFHATHVAGTIGSAHRSYLGMAPGVPIHSYDTRNDEGELADTAAASAESTSGVYVSNHSYGYPAGWGRGGKTWYGPWGVAEDPAFGSYDQSAKNYDQIAHDSQFLLSFHAAGNQRQDRTPPQEGRFIYYGSDGVFHTENYNSLIHPGADGRTKTDVNNNPLTRWDGYDTMSGDKTAKNIVTIGAIHHVSSGGSETISSAEFSSWGPCDDGRIKPDIVAEGVDVLSASNESTSATYAAQGTSMATPCASGSGLLLQQLYKTRSGHFMRASTLKGLIIHSADDADTTVVGPDFRYGWGLMNTEAAALLINEQISHPEKFAISEETLPDGDSILLDIYADGNEPLRATLCWTDPVPGDSEDAVDEQAKALINDLDLRILAPNGNTELPYAFNKNHSSYPGPGSLTRADNLVDNVEQVYIPQNRVTRGWYQVRVSHKGTLEGGPQPFSLCISGQSTPPAAGLYAGKCSKGIVPKGGEATFSVVFWEEAGTAPTVVNTIIDGASHAMTPGDGDIATGRTYAYTTNSLTSGNHSFSFEADYHQFTLTTAGGTIKVDDSLALTLEQNSFRVNPGEMITIQGRLTKGGTGVAGETIRITYSEGLLETGTTDPNGNFTIAIQTPDVPDVTEVLLNVEGIDNGTSITVPVDLHLQDHAEDYRVHFDLGQHGSRSGGGDLTQQVSSGETCNAPSVTPLSGWQHDGWDTDFSSVTSNLLIRATYSLLDHLVSFDLGTHGRYTAGAPLAQTIVHGSAASAPEITANAGWVFVGWDSELTNISADTDIKATYVPYAQHQLTYTADAGGFIEGPASQSIVVTRSGRSVAAVAETGYKFDKWSDGLTDNPRRDENVAVPVEVSASFIAVPIIKIAYQTTEVPNGSWAPSTLYGTYFDQISAGRSVQKTFEIKNEGAATLKLTGSPVIGTDGDSNFAVDAVGYNSIPAKSSKEFVITYTSSSVTAGAATWIQIDCNDADAPSYGFAVFANYSYTHRIVHFDTDGTVGAEIYGMATQFVDDGGDSWPVSVVAPRGYVFAGWTGDYTSREDSLVIPAVTKDMAVTANFDHDPSVESFSLTYKAEANGSIEGVTDQRVPRGRSGKAVTAVPAAGYEFVDWNDGSTQNPRTDTSVMEDIIVTARFDVRTYSLTYGVDGHGSVEGDTDQSLVLGGNGTTVTAVPEEGYRFSTWSDASTHNPRTDTNVAKDINVRAVFVDINTSGGDVNDRNEGSKCGCTVGGRSNALLPLLSIVCIAIGLNSLLNRKRNA